jgi:hypothetical protein
MMLAAARGRYVCGDYRSTGSVQGALAAGAGAAREILAGVRSGSRRRRDRAGNQNRIVMNRCHVNIGTAGRGRVRKAGRAGERVAVAETGWRVSAGAKGLITMSKRAGLSPWPAPAGCGPNRSPSVGRYFANRLNVMIRTGVLSPGGNARAAQTAPRQYLDGRWSAN